MHSEAPFNAEPPLDRLRASFVTAAQDFYVRSHGDIPKLDAATHRLRVCGRVDRPLDLSMADLQALAPQRTLGAVLQCAGNRRADLQPVKPTSGDPWAAGAIGYAHWTGVALHEVLRAAGAAASAHVAFDGADQVEMAGRRFRYGVSIGMPRALQDDVLLAWAMNGETLRPEHGHPLRVVVPFYAGVRSPKWLTTITVQDHPSDNHMQQQDYKLLPASVTEATVDWQAGLTINEMPLNAAICTPQAQARLAPGATTIRGYAIAGRRAVARVDVSADGGGSWVQAALRHDPETPGAWTFWATTLDLPQGEHELVARAWDEAGQTQPACAGDVWNFKGYLCAAWHRVPVSVR
ncbi:sulfite oxidase [Lichenicoccus sp.]|uniref:sulfite oxidase n=1 Tax=Lichenicoccus sp. TaxID=2781899 RepID=UPI003D0D24AB